MKSIGTVILAAGTIFLSQLLNAQTAIGAPDSIVQITADAQGLTLVPPAEVPPFGTFWLVPPEGGGAPAPLPCPPFDPSLPVYAITADQFLVDSTSDGQPASITPPAGRLTASSTSAAALEAQANAVVNLILQVQTAAANQQMRLTARALGLNDLSPGSGDYGDGSGDYSPADTRLKIDTNRLWLEIVTVTNQTASLVIHPPRNVSNEVYELLYSTNLLVPPTSWQWVLRSYPDVTNLLVRNATNTQGFYRLSTADDPIANSSLGTNFWLAFCGLFDNGAIDLSLIISSPVGATGTVFTPGLLHNGPILVITNCGDLAVNGTYVLTYLTTNAQQDLGASDSTGYGKGTNWVVFRGTFWTLYAYDSNARIPLPLYDLSQVNLNGSAADWQLDGDPVNTTNPTSICVQIPLVSRTFTVAAGAVTNISIPLAAMLDVYDVVKTNGIHVTANHPVSIYGQDYDPHATTAFTAYPTKLLGTNYCVMARPSNADGYFSQLAIVATESNTTVRITPSPTANLDCNTNFYTVTNLLPGQTYQIHSTNDAAESFTNDVTGTWIVSDKPIAVFAGANLARVPDTGTLYANPLVQEQMPVDSWGKEALALSFAGRTGGDSYRVLAAYTNTIVFTNDVRAGTNQAGQFLDLLIDGPVEFRGSQPIQVAHFANGTDFDSQTGDPCEILLTPIGHCLMTNIVATLPSGNITGDIVQSYLNIIVIQSAITNTLVDGSHLATTGFVPIAKSGYYGLQFPLTSSGVHTVISSAPVSVEIYGFGDQDAYGYFGGIVQ